VLIWWNPKVLVWDLSECKEEARDFGESGPIEVGQLVLAIRHLNLLYQILA
jgi:hypothetical protein